MSPWRIIHNDHRPTHNGVDAQVNGVALIARTHPAIFANEGGNCWIDGARFLRHLNRLAFVTNDGAGITEARATYTLCAIALLTTPTHSSVFSAEEPFADATWLVADRTGVFIADGTFSRMRLANDVATIHPTTHMLCADSAATACADTAAVTAQAR